MKPEYVDSPVAYYCQGCAKKHSSDLWVGFENDVFFCFQLEELPYVMKLAEDAYNEDSPA